MNKLAGMLGFGVMMLAGLAQATPPRTWDAIFHAEGSGNTKAFPLSGKSVL